MKRILAALLTVPTELHASRAGLRDSAHDRSRGGDPEEND